MVEDCLGTTDEPFDTGSAEFLKELEPPELLAPCLLSTKKSPVTSRNTTTAPTMERRASALSLVTLALLILDESFSCCVPLLPGSRNDLCTQPGYSGKSPRGWQHHPLPHVFTRELTSPSSWTKIAVSISFSNTERQLKCAHKQP